MLGHDSGTADGRAGRLIQSTRAIFGYKAEQQPISIHDLHATMLHLLRIDHLRLTDVYRELIPDRGLNPRPGPVLTPNPFMNPIYLTDAESLAS